MIDKMIEQRKSQRFELKLPMELVRAGSVSLGKPGETQNLSSSGVLFRTEASVALGEPLEYLITLPVTANSPEVRLRCMGKVIRLEESSTAVTLERYEFVRA